MWKAFERLTTTRPRAFGIGPISYREVMTYATEMELDPNTREFLWEVMKRVDTWYVRATQQKMQEEQDKARAMAHRPRELPSG